MIDTGIAAETTAASPQIHRETPEGLPEDGTDPLDSYEVVIRPRSGWISLDWREMLSYRELLGFLMWRDFSARYKQTVLGGAWAVVQPLVMMSIFSFLFGRVVRIRTPVPYPVFIFAGLIPWQLFSQGFAQASMSLVNNQQLLTKVYFPRVFVPIASASIFLVDMAISFLLYGLILAYYGVMPSATVILAPALIGLTLVATWGLGLTISALTVFYRDFRHIIPFMTQIMFYMTPIIIPSDYITKKYVYVLSVNPMFGITSAFRSAILGTDRFPFDGISLAISATSAFALLSFGLLYFRRTERRFADFA
jgi:lipopolysaccharide transport system permease protein